MSAAYDVIFTQRNALNTGFTEIVLSPTASALLGFNPSKGIINVATSGSGTIALTTSPVFVTPTLGAALATSINVSTTITLPSTNTITASGSTTVTTGFWQFIGPIIASSGIRGVNDGSNASAGFIGQYLSAEMSDSPGTALTTATYYNVFGVATAAITLTAGDWEVGGSIYINTTAAALTQVVSGIHTTSAVTPNTTAVTAFPLSITSTNRIKYVLPTQRFSVSVSTPLYLNLSVAFSSGAAAGGGTVWARRSANAK